MFPGGSAAERTRTFDRLVNSQPLYLAELRRQSNTLMPLWSPTKVFKFSLLKTDLFYLSYFILSDCRKALVEFTHQSCVPFALECPVEQIINPMEIMLNALDRSCLCRSLRLVFVNQ